MKKLFYLYVLIIITTLARVPSVMAATADTNCSGDLGVVTIPGNLIVSNSCQCTLTGTTVKGNVIVNSGGRITTNGAHISGLFQATGADRIQLLQGSWIGGNVTITGTNGVDPSVISGSQIRGSLTLTQNLSEIDVNQNTVNGALLVTRSAGTAQETITNNQITGALTLNGNLAKVDARWNTVSDNLVVSNNTGGITVKENTIKGNLSCKNNNPAPRGGDNTVGGNIIGQCLGMAPPVVAVPNIIGMSQADAKTALTNAYLLFGAISSDYSNTIPTGNVISLNPPAGTIVDEDTSVNFVISLGPAPPTVTLDASKTTITNGDSTALTWTSTNADTCSIAPGIGSVAVNGTMPVSLTETTTYTITATGPGGVATAQVTVTVTGPPQVSFNASATLIQSGQSVALSWQTGGASLVYINQGVGAVSSDRNHNG